MKGVKRITDLDLEGHRLLLRLDLNVPLRDGQITSEARIRAALPTIRHALEAGAGLVLCSHLGRPKGKPVPEMGLEPVGARLSEILNTDVLLADDCIGDGVKALVTNLRPGGIVLLENLRFRAGEKKNDPDFARALAAPFDLKADAYVNDAFGSCHRAHASIVGVVELFENRAAGFLLEKELEAIGKLIDSPQEPFVAVVGGAKVADKLGILEALLGRVQTLCIGGAMAYTFLNASNHSIGSSRLEEGHLQAAKNLLTMAERRGVEVILPIDHVVAEEFEAHSPPIIVEQASIGAGQIGMDIGPKTRTKIVSAVSGAKTVFWNGPMGVFEWESFAAGTKAVAEAVAGTDGYTVVGGGDSVAAIEAAGVVKQIDHVSTGGGASLELLQKETLPGIEALES